MKKRSDYQKKKDRKERMQFIHIENHDPTLAFELSDPKPDGSISFLDSLTKKSISLPNASVGTSYARSAKQPKVINQIWKTELGEVKSDQDQYLLEFDDIFAIDTNTNIHTHRSISACIHMEKIDKARTYQAHYLDAIQFNSRGIEKPENFAWRVFIPWCQKFSNPNKEILVTVDSDLGVLPLINQRKQPIFDGYFLPIGVTLAYGSADVGMEFLKNKLINRCDKICTYLEKNTPPINTASTLKIPPELMELPWT